MDKKSESSYKITFRVKHPYISFDDLSKKLKLEPRFGWSVGGRAKNRRNEEFGPIKNYTYYYFLIDCNETMSISDEIVNFLNNLKKHKNFLDSLLSTGGVISIYIAWFVDSSLTGEIFQSSLLKSMSDLQINLEIEIYPNAY